MSKQPQHIPSPHQMLAAITQVRDLLATLDPSIIEDAQLAVDTIEGETDAMLVLDQLGNAALYAEGLADLAREHAKAMSARAARFDKRSDSLRAGMLMMLQTMHQQRVERADFTASVQAKQPELVVDEAELEEAYQRIKVEPNRTLIRKDLTAGHKVRGAYLGPAGQSIRINRT